MNSINVNRTGRQVQDIWSALKYSASYYEKGGEGDNDISRTHRELAEQLMAASKANNPHPHIPVTANYPGDGAAACSDAEGAPGLVRGAAE